MRGSSNQIISEVACFYLSQYATRLRLKKLGYTDSIENLDCITAEAFNVISQEIDKIEEAESKKKNKR